LSKFLVDESLDYLIFPR